MDKNTCSLQCKSDMSYEKSILQEFQKRLQQPAPKVSVQEIQECCVKLGDGGFGSVYVAKWHGSVQAVKMIDKRRLKKKKKRNIQNEIKLLHALSHPMIVKLQFTAETRAHLYVGMELASGGDLFDLLIEKGPLCEVDARLYTAQIVLALEYLHQVQVLHRDVKPANCLVMHDGYLKLCDFGEAVVRSGAGTVGWVGTDGFVAPEVTCGYHTPAMDVWSLGVVLYFMLTLLHPEDIASHINFYGPNDAFSPHLRALLAAMFQYEPSARPSSKQIRDSKWLAAVDVEKVFYKEVRAPFLPPGVWKGDIGKNDSPWISN